MTSDHAKVGVLKVALEIKRQTGCSFTEAWKDADPAPRPVFNRGGHAKQVEALPFCVSGNQIFNGIVALVRNRTGQDYQTVFNRALADNADILVPTVDATRHTLAFQRLTNRAHVVTGLGLAASHEIAADKVAKLCNRFFPELYSAPTALQWSVLTKTAEQLEKLGIPDRLLNRRAGDPEVSASDWKKATGCEDYVLSVLADESQPMDRGTLPSLNGPSPVVRGVFRSAVRRLMDEEQMTARQAFDKLKEDEPIFWTMAILSFEPEP